MIAAFRRTARSLACSCRPNPFQCSMRCKCPGCHTRWFPMLFSAPMVLALLAGRKTQTRRGDDMRGADRVRWHVGETHWWAGKPPQPYEGWVAQVDKLGNLLLPLKCPYGQPGDRLWVRETWAVEKRFDRRRPSRVPKGSRVHYLADGQKPAWAGRTRVSIFMPRWASRLALEVSAVGVERLLDISESDAVAEGLLQERSPIGRGRPRCWSWPGALASYRRASEAYLAGWDWLNGEGAAKKNPLVWVVEFKRGEVRG